MLKPKELTKLKTKLPKGYFKTIVDRVPHSERTVANFFNGTTYKADIHTACLDLIQETENLRNSVAAQHKSIVDHG